MVLASVIICLLSCFMLWSCSSLSFFLVFSSSSRLQALFSTFFTFNVGFYSSALSVIPLLLLVACRYCLGTSSARGLIVQWHSFLFLLFCFSFFTCVSGFFVTDNLWEVSLHQGCTSFIYPLCQKQHISVLGCGCDFSKNLSLHCCEVNESICLENVRRGWLTKMNIYNFSIKFLGLSGWLNVDRMWMRAVWS